MRPRLFTDRRFIILHRVITQGRVTTRRRLAIMHRLRASMAPAMDPVMEEGVQAMVLTTAVGGRVMAVADGMAPAGITVAAMATGRRRRPLDQDRAMARDLAGTAIQVGIQATVVRRRADPQAVIFVKTAALVAAATAVRAGAIVS